MADLMELVLLNCLLAQLLKDQLHQPQEQFDITLQLIKQKFIQEQDGQL